MNSVWELVVICGVFSVLGIVSSFSSLPTYFIWIGAGGMIVTGLLIIFILLTKAGKIDNERTMY